MFNDFFSVCYIDKCSLIECKNEGTCDIQNGKAVCICPDKYTGNNCETGLYDI